MGPNDQSFASPRSEHRGVSSCLPKWGALARSLLCWVELVHDASLAAGTNFPAALDENGLVSTVGFIRAGSPTLARYRIR